MNNRITDVIVYTVAALIVIIATLLFNSIVMGLLYLTIRFWSVEQAVIVFKNGTAFLVVLECAIYLFAIISNLLPDKKDKGDE